MTIARGTGSRALRTVQVSFHVDARQRDGESLLDAWPTLPNVASAVARAGAEVTVVQAAATRQTITRDDVTYRFVDDARGMPARAYGVIPLVRRPSRIIADVIALAPDIVHVHGLSFPVAVWHLTRALPNVPVLVQDHASRPPRGVRRAAWRAAYRDLAAVSFTTRAHAEPFFAARALSTALPVFEVLEGSSTFTPGEQAAAQRDTGMYGDPCVLWAAHLDENKDPLVALEAFRLAAPSLPDARLWCCFRSAPLLREVDRAIADSPLLRERVTLLDALPHADMEEHFRAADLFVHASHRESCGYALIEALSCGTPVIATDLPSTRRIVGECGTLVPVGDAAAMAETLGGWTGDHAGQRRGEARRRFEETLSFDRIGSSLVAVYDELVARR